MISENTIQHEIDSENIDFLALCKSNPKVGFHKSIELLKKAETHGYAKGTAEALRNLAFASQLLGLIPE